jgi:hypothetical protein
MAQKIRKRIHIYYIDFLHFREQAYITWFPRDAATFQSVLCGGMQNVPTIYASLPTLSLLLLLLLTAIGLSPGGSSPTLVQTKIKKIKCHTYKGSLCFPAFAQ